MPQHKQGIRGTFSISSNVNRIVDAPHTVVNPIMVKGHIEAFRNPQGEVIQRQVASTSKKDQMIKDSAMNKIRNGRFSFPSKTSKINIKSILVKRPDTKEDAKVKTNRGNERVTFSTPQQPSPQKPREIELKKELDKLKELDLPLSNEIRKPERPLAVRVRRLVKKIFFKVLVPIMILSFLGFATWWVVSSQVLFSPDIDSEGREIKAPHSVLSLPREQRTALRPARLMPPPGCPSMRRSSAYYDVRWHNAWPGQNPYEPLWIRPLDRNVYYSREVEAMVSIIPFSIVGPGSDEKFEVTLNRSFRILDNLVVKLSQYKTMTFMWSEVGLLAEWWKTAHKEQKDAIRRFITEGRFEITNGGWVTPEEGVTGIFGLLHQQLEGQFWLKKVLRKGSMTGWLGGVFGHSPVLSYLLKLSGIIGGTIMDKIPLSWVKPLFLNHMCTFLWRQDWDLFGTYDNFIYVHPFKSLTTEEGCGPNEDTCNEFNLYKSFKNKDLSFLTKDFSDLYLAIDSIGEQLWKTAEGKHFPFVILPLGGAYAFEDPLEWDVQFKTFSKAIEAISIHNFRYPFKMEFSTPSVFLSKQLAALKFGRELPDIVPYPTITGDFHPYFELNTRLDNHLFWSGFFSSRAFLKVLGRELETQLRAAEILFTLSHKKAPGSVEDSYQRILKARKELAFFQHHSLISGGSKSTALLDFYERLRDSLTVTTMVQKQAIEALVPGTSPLNYVATNINNFEKGPHYKPIDVLTSPKTIVVFNSLAHGRYQVVKVLINRPNVLVKDNAGNVQVHQISPIWLKINDSDDSQVFLSRVSYELKFITYIKGLSLLYFTVQKDTSRNGLSRLICTMCPKSNQFEIKQIPLARKSIENHKFKLNFNAYAGFLDTVEEKGSGRVFEAHIRLLTHSPVNGTSDEYVFNPSHQLNSEVRRLLNFYNLRGITYVEGPVFSEVRILYDHLIEHVVCLYHSETPLGNGIFIETSVDFPSLPYPMDVDLVMEIRTSIDNTRGHHMATDLNGFQMDMRSRKNQYGLSSSYYPLGTAVYIQNDLRRMTLLVDHPQGVSNFDQGTIKVMIGRNIDSKMKGNHYIDQRYTSKYWLLFEDLNVPEKGYPRLSLHAHYLSLALQHPLNVFITEQSLRALQFKDNYATQLSLLTSDFPCNLHLLTMRMLSQDETVDLPSSSSLMVIQPLPYTCYTQEVAVDKCQIREQGYLFPANVFTELSSMFHESDEISQVLTTDKKVNLNELSYFPPLLKLFRVTFS